MRNIQKQLCGIALLLFGLIIAVASLALNRMMALLGCAVGLFGLARTFLFENRRIFFDIPAPA